MEKAREAVDVSNMRVAYAVGMSDVLTKGYEDNTAYKKSGNGDATTYTGYYTTDGKMVATKPTTGYGKATMTGLQGGTPDWPSTGFTYTGVAVSSGTAQVVKVVITPANTVPVAISWE